MHEQELLQHIYAKADGTPSKHVELGPGDDCAIIRAGSERLLLSTDQLIAGRHYDDSASTDQIARKAIARALSDIAAMAGEPIATLAAACLPPDHADTRELFDRVHHWGEHFGAPVIGGDIATAQVPATLTITAIGRVPAGCKPILRSTARPGDAVYVTGKLGGSFHSGRHLSFDPRITEALHLVRTLGPSLHAMIDLSDGLGIDAARIATASGVRIRIDHARIPTHPDVQSWQHAVSDGEDYELCFTVHPDQEVPPVCPHTSTPISRIGTVLEPNANPGLCEITNEQGEVIDISTMGWNHGQS